MFPGRYLGIRKRASAVYIKQRNTPFNRFEVKIKIKSKLQRSHSVMALQGPYKRLVGFRIGISVVFSFQGNVDVIVFVCCFVAFLAVSYEVRLINRTHA